MFIIGVEHVISVVGVGRVSTYGAGGGSDELSETVLGGGLDGVRCLSRPAGLGGREVRRGLRILDTGS